MSVGHALVAVNIIQLQPMSHRRAEPDGQPIDLFGRDAGQAAEQLRHAVATIPCREAVQPVFDGVEQRDIIAVDLFREQRLQGLHPIELLAGSDDDAVLYFGRQGLEGCTLLAALKHFQFVTDHVLLERIILAEELLRQEHPRHVRVLFGGKENRSFHDNRNLRVNE